MPISDIYGLRAAIDNIAADPAILSRHAKIASASRKAISGAGLNLYLHSGYSSTVTVFEVPEGTTAEAILEGVKKDYNIMLAGSFDVLAGKVIRIGHMGNNAAFYNVREVFAALDGTLRRLGVPLKASMEISSAKTWHQCSGALPKEAETESTTVRIPYFLRSGQMADTSLSMPLGVSPCTTVAYL